MWLFTCLLSFNPSFDLSEGGGASALVRYHHVGPLAVFVCLQLLTTTIFALEAWTPWGTAHLFWGIQTCPSMRVVLWNNFHPRMMSLFVAVGGCCTFWCQSKSSDRLKLFFILPVKRNELRQKTWLDRIGNENFRPSFSNTLCKVSRASHYKLGSMFAQFACSSAVDKSQIIVQNGAIFH